MKYRSIIEARGIAPFPEFLGDRVYMREFRKRSGLPSDLARWQPTIDAMLDGIETDQPIYIMVDEGFVQLGTTHRRAGLHIDGYWNPGIHAHGGTDGGMPPHHKYTPPGHGYERIPTGGHGYAVPGHSGSPGHNKNPPGRHLSGDGGWSQAEFADPEGLILVSNVSAARGFVGDFHGPIGDGGDCSHIDLSGLAEITMKEGVVYAGNVTALHESLPVRFDCFRQLVRLNVPGWEPRGKEGE